MLLLGYNYMVFTWLPLLQGVENHMLIALRSYVLNGK